MSAAFESKKLNLWGGKINELTINKEDIAQINHFFHIISMLAKNLAFVNKKRSEWMWKWEDCQLLCVRNVSSLISKSLSYFIIFHLFYSTHLCLPALSLLISLRSKLGSREYKLRRRKKRISWMTSSSSSSSSHICMLSLSPRERERERQQLHIE